MGNDRTEKYVSANSMQKAGDGEILDKVMAKPGELPVKDNMPRNSLLTELYEIKHIQTIYNIFLAILTGLFINTAAYDYLYKEKVQLGFSLIIKGFSKLHIALFIWLCAFLSSLLIYVGFKYWAIIRTQLRPKSTELRIWDHLCLATFIAYYPSLLYFSAMAITEWDLAIAESIALLMDVTRLLMKAHAFVRSNAPRVLKYKPHAEDQILYPEFSKFLYFSFAPTAVYRDSYPRSTCIRWNYVAKCFLEVFGIIYFISFVLERFYIPVFEDYGIRPYSWQEIVITILENSAAGMLIMLNVFYGMLHAWMNAFAEMLKFSDRMFYKDWWTSPAYGRYYRTWNIVVHDWLYTYIYKDFYEIILPKNKFAAKYVVFFVSAVFHEYVLGFSFRFCLPILFIQFFGPGAILSFFKIKNHLIGNVFLWKSLALGMSINACAYTIEYYARVNCPIENATLSSYLVPRLFSCNK